jgi:hypothetical protein
MISDNEPTVTLLNCRNSFEADTIAQALQARGINAQPIDSANAGIWLGVNNLSQAKIVVLASDEPAARRALEEIKSEVSTIDWSTIDVGDESEGVRLTEAARTRRWMWTLLVVLVPIGLFILAYGMQRSDRMIQLLGGVLIATSIALGLGAMSPDKTDPAGTDRDGLKFHPRPRGRSGNAD